MMAITRGLGVCIALAGAAIGLAGPASAEGLSGPYTATVIDGPMKHGGRTTWTLSSCGPDCTHIDTRGATQFTLHLQGNTWTGPWTGADGTPCTANLDNSSLVLTEQCPNFPDLVVGLAKNG
jgi:hypothetical protein